jgi:SOS response regulatory protein OraA/RecX
MLDIAKATEVLEDYFENVTQEQFALDLRRFCPELFEQEEKNLKLEKLKNAEIYQKAKEDNKLEIAPKLLQKGFSIEEIAEILELDKSLIAQ